MWLPKFPYYLGVHNADTGVSILLRGSQHGYRSLHVIHNVDTGGLWHPSILLTPLKADEGLGAACFV